MPPERTTVTIHVHTDGPIPGPHSLLSVTAVAHAANGDAIGTFHTNVRELPGATLHPVALQQWRRRAEDWLTTRRASRPPAPAMTALTRWVDPFPGEKVLVSDPTGADHLFLYWYLQRFTGRWPFSGTELDGGPDRSSAEAMCPLTGCRQPARAC